MKIPVRLPIKVGKTYYMTNGKEVRIYSTGGSEKSAIHGAFRKNADWEIFSWDKNGIAPHGDLSGQDIAYEEWEPQDMELVWCWNRGDKFLRFLKFYDAENNCTFSSENGERNSSCWDYYAPFDGEYPEWAKEALRELKD